MIGRVGKWTVLAIAVPVLIAIGIAYYAFDPATSDLAPKCMFHSLTGWDCPGCGSQRMIHALLHGDVAGAWSANAFLLCATPALIVIAFSAALRTRLPRLYRIVNSVPVIIAVGVALIGWTLGRNLL